MSSITISKIPVHKAYFFQQWERPVLLTVLLSLISMQGYMKFVRSDGQVYIYPPKTVSVSTIDLVLYSYCAPDFFVLCRDQFFNFLDGPLWQFWSDRRMWYASGNEEVDKYTSNFVFSTSAFPNLMSYSGNSPDIPAWLKTINNAVLAEQYNNSVFGFSTRSRWMDFDSNYANKEKFSWYYANKELVEKKCSFKFHNVVARKLVNCSTRTFYQTEESLYQVHETNNTAGFNLHYQELIHYFDADWGDKNNSVDPVGDRHKELIDNPIGEQLERLIITNSSTRTLHLRCCSDYDLYGFGNDPKNNRFVQLDYNGHSLYICSPAMCNPTPKSMNEIANILSFTWKRALKKLIDLTASELNRYLHYFQSSSRTNLFSSAWESSVYNITELLSLFGSGTGNRTVQNLVDFFAIRDNSTSDTFVTMDSSANKNQITRLPNHLWNIDTFMEIIERATLEFHEDSIVTGIAIDTTDQLQQPIVDAVLESIVLRRQNGWNVPAINSSLSKIDTPVFDDVKKCIMRQATDLLEGSKCWQAMELYPKAIASLDTTMINKGRAVYVHFVGALLIASLMLQSWIRYHRLPGGLYYTYDKERLKRRREQVRMALNDEYLCRVQEHHATQQFGKERAREVLDTLKNAANREADLPSNYQYRQRKLSRRVIVVGHIFLMLIGPLNDLDAYMNLLCVVLLVNLLQSLLESKACKLVEQQSLTKREMEATHLCPTLEVNCPNLEHKETPLPSVQSSLFSNV